MFDAVKTWLTVPIPRIQGIAQGALFMLALVVVFGLACAAEAQDTTLVRTDTTEVTMDTTVDDFSFTVLP